MSQIHIVRDYPHSPRKVWRAVTDPDLIALLSDLDETGALRPDTTLRLPSAHRAG